MTFSLVGRCHRTGMLGLVVTSSSAAVAARCAWARGGVGAVATQNVTDPSLAPQVLDRMEHGRSAADALSEVMAKAPFAEYRQLAVIDAAGRTASYSGARTLGRHRSSSGRDCLAAGNLLADGKVTSAMVHAFERRPQDHLADRLLDALRAGAAAGGEVVRHRPAHRLARRPDHRAGAPVGGLAAAGSRLPPARPRPHSRPELRSPRG